jgi:hypothetical protein
VVVREWQADQRTRAGDSFYSSLRSKYEVRYEGEIGQLLQQAANAASKK